VSPEARLQASAGGDGAVPGLLRAVRGLRLSAIALSAQEQVGRAHLSEGPDMLGRVRLCAARHADCGSTARETGDE
jgi:hypothetical protein